MSSQQCLEGSIILTEDKQFWTVQFMSTLAFSYNIDKSVLTWSQLERIMCIIFKIIILDLHQTCFYQKWSMESWVSSGVSLFCRKPCKIIFSANLGNICLHSRARFASVLCFSTLPKIHGWRAIEWYFWDFWCRIYTYTLLSEVIKFLWPFGEVVHILTDLKKIVIKLFFHLS